MLLNNIVTHIGSSERWANGGLMLLHKAYKVQYCIQQSELKELHDIQKLQYFLRDHLTVLCFLGLLVPISRSCSFLHLRPSM